LIRPLLREQWDGRIINGNVPNRPPKEILARRPFVSSLSDQRGC